MVAIDKDKKQETMQDPQDCAWADMAEFHNKCDDLRQRAVNEEHTHGTTARVPVSRYKTGIATAGYLLLAFQRTGNGETYGVREKSSTAMARREPTLPFPDYPESAQQIDLMH